MNNNYTPRTPTGTYNLDDAVLICKMIEPVCCKYGFHIALTGGTLYGEGGRKDIDVVFYRIRQVAEPDVQGMNRELALKDMILLKDYGFCKKYMLAGVVPIDALFPENWIGGYGLEHLTVEKETIL